MADKNPDPKTSDVPKTPGRSKEFGEFNPQGVRSRNVKVFVRLDVKNKDNRKKNPDNFVEIEYTEPNYKTVDAAQKAVGQNLLAVLNDGVAAQEKKNAVSLVSTARNLAKTLSTPDSPVTIQDAMATIRTMKANRKGK